MGVVFHPTDHHRAIQCKESHDHDMELWSWKVQSENITTTCRRSTELRQAATSHALTSSEDYVNGISNMTWISKSCNQHVIKDFVKCKQLLQWRTLKRLADEIVAPRRRFKRQRVAVQYKNQFMISDKEQSERYCTTSPRSLQYALPNLTSHDTLCILHAMHTIPSELRHLNSRASCNRLHKRCEVHQVFGWRHLLCQEDDDGDLARRVVWKSAKALDSMMMRPLARQIWRASTEISSASHGKETGKLLYTINRIARVIYSTNSAYGTGDRRCNRHQIWLECFLDDGLQVCVARKELRQFSDYCVPEISATECEGFLVRPVYTRTINTQLVGCSLHCLRAVDASDKGVSSASALKQKLIQELPQHTLQWEEDNIYDLIKLPQVLLDSIFA
ncbi:uncharacterized protein PHALS_13100 [Plasmopara halstedii]|uniref:Uncharacterized protein n=1 Tax=Plasmopara halstedii TaxID=4781 RepID=A0A0P1ANU6_PLAHL|nr:uncharacterized protein PHALS_13100 [Plasmopara halstedii]CEG42863.1 hypothetical protein PHALS_13100 [Plasmopara halstedii]|eukprot:XP_024579232.1 hypothetical protein PHALS_13100 [Plasmopara halstedii]